MANEVKNKNTTTKSKSTTTKKTGTTTPKKTSAAAKKTSATAAKKTSTSTAKKTSATTSKKVSPKKGNTTKKPITKTAVKKVKTTKPTPKKKTKNLRVKKDSELTTLEVLEASVEGKPIKEKEKFGKAYYLGFSVVFYAGAFFYINNIVYDNSDLLQSAIFAFAALFVVFVLLLFNVHMMLINFFVLPFKRLFRQSKHELKKEIIFSVGKNKIQTGLNKYKAIFTLTLYTLISIALMYSIISGGITGEKKILSIITQALLTEFIFLIIVCSWQYLFNIIPSILDKSLDAKNGFILTLSAAVMIIYILFGIFEITYLAEIMIFVLIIGFVALLGVNLNMIVGEINIFQNLRNRKNKAITRIVFLIFFGFHIYVVLYASVVAFSIYVWEPESYNFAYVEMENEIDTDLFYVSGEPIDEVADQFNAEIDTVYDSQGNVITDFVDEDGYAVIDVYDVSSNMIFNYYEPDTTNLIQSVFDEEGKEYFNFFYHDGTLGIQQQVEIPADYGDFLYYTFVTVSTLGYGDITPSQSYNIAQVWGGFLSMYGLTFFALSIGFVSNIAMEGVVAVREEDNND